MIMKPLRSSDAERIAPSPHGRGQGVRGSMGPGTKPLTLTLSPRERGHGGRRRKANSHDRNVIEGLGVAHEALDVIVEAMAHREHTALLRRLLYGTAVRHDSLQTV